MDLEFLENLQEKNPKIIAEYFFENYEHNEVNKLVKQIQYLLLSPSLHLPSSLGKKSWRKTTV